MNAAATRKKLIEVALPLDAINKASALSPRTFDETSLELLAP